MLNLLALTWVHLIFFFIGSSTTEIYTLSLHDALPIYHRAHVTALAAARHAGVTQVVLLSALCVQKPLLAFQHAKLDRKSTRLNSSHPSISYAVFCLKKKITTKPKLSLRHLVVHYEWR